MKRSSSTSLTMLRAVALGIVCENSPTYGLAIAAEVKSRTGIIVGPGSLYRVLKYLRRKRFITASKEEVSTHQGPRRTYYSPTKAGFAALEKYRRELNTMLLALRPKSAE